MMTVGERIMEGMGAAAWLIGFIAMLGVVMIVAGIIVLLCTYVAQAWDEMDRMRDNAAAEKRRAQAVSDGNRGTEG